MTLFAGSRDISLFRSLNQELLHNIIETVCGYYKIDLSKSSTNLYGEANGSKFYLNPVLVPCYIDRGEPSNVNNENLPDRSRLNTFRFLRDDLIQAVLIPEAGDIIMYNENYFEADLIVENQFFMGKNPDYSYSSDTEDFGTSLSMIVQTHQIKPEIPGILLQQL
jgi:hypothetical protein